MTEIPEPKISVIFPDPLSSPDVKVILYKPLSKYNRHNWAGIKLKVHELKIAQPPQTSKISDII